MLVFGAGPLFFGQFKFEILAVVNYEFWLYYDFEISIMK